MKSFNTMKQNRKFFSYFKYVFIKTCRHAKYMILTKYFELPRFVPGIKEQIFKAVNNQKE